MVADTGEHSEMKYFVRADDRRNEDWFADEIDHRANRIRKRSPKERADEPESETAPKDKSAQRAEPTHAEIKAKVDAFGNRMEKADAEYHADGGQEPHGDDYSPAPDALKEHDVNGGKGRGNENEYCRVVETLQNIPHHFAASEKVIEAAESQKRDDRANINFKSDVSAALLFRAAKKGNGQETENNSTDNMRQAAYRLGKAGYREDLVVRKLHEECVPRSKFLGLTAVGSRSANDARKAAASCFKLIILQTE